MPDTSKPRRVLRAPAVREMTGYSDVQLWRLEKAGRFPKSFKLSDGGRAKGWWEDEILSHQVRRDAARNAPKAA